MICANCERVFSKAIFTVPDHHVRSEDLLQSTKFRNFPADGIVYFVAHSVAFSFKYSFNNFAQSQSFTQACHNGSKYAPCRCCAWLLRQNLTPGPDHDYFGFWILRQSFGISSCNAGYGALDGKITNVDKVPIEIASPHGGSFDIVAMRNTPAASSVCRRPTPKKDDFSHIDYWLEDCLNNHPTHTHVKKRCGAYSDSKLPKRVLDLNWEHDSTDVRLMETLEGQRGQYAALTYAWGPKPSGIFKTEPHTISQRMKGISLNDLNPLFQQVIYVCRSLRIPYLWIDALCIIQGDKMDWKEQAPRMCDIYSNAFLTLSATDAQSPNEQILRETKQSDTLAMPYYRGDQGQVFLQPQDKENIRGDEARKGVVNGRGWCLQERYLSKRILHFTAKGVEWECLSTTQHEGRDLSLAYDGESVLIRPHGFDLGEEDPYDIWYRVLQEYSRRTMSFDTDLLPGISGLAALFRRLANDNLLDCGLWSSQPLLGLLWEHSFSTNRRLSSEPAPSWSWLNTVGAKVWRPICHPTCVAVEEMTVEDENHTITLRGILLTLPSELRYYYGHPCYDEDLERPFSFLEETFDFELDENIEEVEGGLFFLVLIRPALDMHEGRVRADGPYKGDTSGWGLLLTSADAGKYKRVGFAEISCESWLYDINCDLEDDQPYEEFWKKHNQELIEVTLV